MSSFPTYGSSQPLRVGMIGLGKTGLVHLQNLQSMPEVTVVAVAESNPNVVFDDAGRILRAVDYQTLIKDYPLDAVVISLPHFLHADAAGLALEQGLDVFLEKPIATSYSESVALVKCAEEQARTLTINMTHRFYPPMRKAQEIMKSGLLGEVISVRDHYMEVIDRSDFPEWFFEPVAAGGGVAITDSVHLIDRVEWLLGERLETVGVVGRKVDAASEVEDCVEFLCKTASEIPVSIGSFFCFSGERTFSDHLTVYGARGVLTVHAWSHVELALYGEPIQRFPGYPDDMAQLDRVALGHRGAMIDFIQSIRERRSPVSAAKEVLNAHRVVQDFYEAYPRFSHESARV